MFKFLIYPLNTALILTLSLFFSLLNLSWFYAEPDEIGILYLLIIIFFHLFLSTISYWLPKSELKNYGINKNTYRYMLYISLGGFFVEFALLGIPLLFDGGRDNYISLPVLHVVFYSLLLCSAIFAALYSSTKELIICLGCIFIVAILLLSRQMIMMSSIMTVIALSLRYKVSCKAVIKFVCYGSLLIIIFGLLGNLRQQLSGDYVDGYIYIVGGANGRGALLWESIYWIWLYIASPIYNLLLNFSSYDNYGHACNTATNFGSCQGDYISNVILPNTFTKYLNLEPFEIDLVVKHLNVGTGYAAAARIMGVWGVVIQLVFQLLLFLIGYIITPKHIKEVFVVYFSTLSFFMLFDNLFVKGEFFFGFVVILVVGFLTRPVGNKGKCA
ncbi:TPA: hypothetical protein MNM99_001916 [Citrobacter freundii]|nr:hypothetical protein [Citrobacter freundii]HCA0717281.1 hypothetical protein [Citrobacter freundii]HCA1541130.1 hypothetical protein [Citrobacter freundii]HCA2003795.1 hypothetical protein [Citrobacter freundii]